jgi:hypothetical protein
MDLLLDHFPVFEANQVLTSEHLNDVFDYLDQQTRQTRSLLIGIGIACGLEFKLGSGPSILLSRGCGVTSDGYLIVEPEDITLTSYRNYVLPADLDYPPFTDPATQAPYPLWELFPDGVANTTALSSPSGFLDDKAVLLFLELKKQGLRNCSPNNCDDKGSEVTATVRRLLIRSTDLDTIIAAANALGAGLSSGDLDAALSARLDLADLRLRRFDVLNSNPATSNDVYAAFLGVFRSAGLAKALGDALSAAYAAFNPLLVPVYPTDPFANFAAALGFLDTGPVNTAQVRFLQYYVDLFDDLVHAYDEFRWKGAELACACCPSSDLFPRHLMLGLVHPENASQPGRYRQGWLASPAVGDCAEETREITQLFARLVEMAARFSNAPPLPAPNPKASVDPQIRITPSTLGDRPLATKAIPYYYAETGSPPLYQLWSVERTRRGRSAQNLGYRSDEYSPAAPAFVTDPLRYDLEPFNFLRIEGHLGKDYQKALASLLTLRTQYRLPIDIIALRTGAYDDTQPVDPAQASAHVQDLEALYEALREELLSSLAEGVRALYDTPVAGLTLPGGQPQLPLLKTYDPNYAYPANSVGAWYEKYLNSFQIRPYIDVDQAKIDLNAVLTVYCTLFSGTTGLANQNYPHAVAVYYLSKLGEILPQQLDALAYADFENKYQDLVGLLQYFRSDAINNASSDLKTFIPQGEFIDLCEEILFGYKLDSIKSVHDEYERRIGDLKKRQFLSNFLAAHPGVQHKAGAPLGGTFILVYHGEPAASRPSISVNAGVLSGLLLEATRLMTDTAAAPAAAVATGAFTLGGAASTASAAAATSSFTDAINRIGSNKVLAENPDINLVLGTLTGRIPITVGGQTGLDDASAKIIAAAVGELSDGAVIADFYLPYRVSCDCPGIQYVLPPPVVSFSADVACTDAAGSAAVTVTPKGGTDPYDVSVDGAVYQALSGPLQLKTGVHSLMLRDAAGIESTAKSVAVAAQLTIGAPTYACDSNGQFSATATITGGVPPYTVNGKAITADSFTTDPAASGSQVAVQVADSASCIASANFTHTCPPPCTLPCGGVTLNRNFRLWLPDVDPNNAYKGAEIGVRKFSVNTADPALTPSGNPVDLTAKVQAILKATPADLASQAAFQKLVTNWMAQLNKVLASVVNLSQAGKAQSLMTLGYSATAPGRLGALSIEYFQCLNFDFEIVANISRASGTESATFVYNQDGISIPEIKVTIPASDGTTTNRCSASPTTTPICATPPTFKLAISPTTANGLSATTFTVAASPAGAAATFLWEAQDGSPAMGNGASFTTKFTSQGTKLLTVTGFTKEGCTVTQQAQISVVVIG